MKTPTLPARKLRALIRANTDYGLTVASVLWVNCDWSRGMAKRWAAELDWDGGIFVVSGDSLQALVADFLRQCSGG